RAVPSPPSRGAVRTPRPTSWRGSGSQCTRIGKVGSSRTLFGLNKKQIGQVASAVSRVRPASMRNNSFTALLVGLLLVSALVAAVQVLRITFATRDLRRLQPRLVEMNAHWNLAQALLNDTLEY